MALPAPQTATSTGFSSDALGYMGLFSSLGSAYSSYVAGKTAKIGYEMQQRASEFEAKLAESEAEYTNMMLMRKFNEQQSNNLAISVAQGRASNSGSLLNMARVDQQRLNWDQQYNTLSGKIGKASKEADAQGYGIAASSAAQQGVTRGLLTLASGYMDYAKIK